MGGALLQKLDRDTQRFAFKCSEAIVDGRSVPVFKDPVTDPAKRSKAGRLSLVRRDGKLTTVAGELHDSLLETVFENGKVLRRTTLDEVRARAGAEFQ
jgi:nicotinamide phosphoribosyltransferase